jgi:predicted transcriptional regulator
MLPAAVTIDMSATLLDAAKRMRDENVGMLPVMQSALAPVGASRRVKRLVIRGVRAQ